MSFFLKLLLFFSILQSQSKFGSIFSVIDSVPSMQNQTKPLINSVSFSYNNQFGIQNTNEFSGLISFKEYNSIISVKSFDIDIFRESETRISSFYSLNNFFFGGEFKYKNQWFKGFKSINTLYFTPSIEFKSSINIYISVEELISSGSKNNSINIALGKNIDQTYIEVYMNKNKEFIFQRITFCQKLGILKVYLAFQNGKNEFLSGLEFYSKIFLFRYSYELYDELGSRSQISLSYFY